jgi:hypothetical protein
VCFVNMPASKTHIVQGRCLRLHPDKRCAQVVLPLVAGADGEEKRARDFMRVLAQNDSRFAHALRAHRGAPYVSVRPASADESEGDEVHAHAVPCTTRWAPRSSARGTRASTRLSRITRRTADSRLDRRLVEGGSTISAKRERQWHRVDAWWIVGPQASPAPRNDGT